MNDPKHPLPGDSHIDASDIAFKDYTSGYIKGLTKLHVGYESAVANVGRLTPTQLQVAGINTDEAAAVVALAEEHKYIGVLHAAATKLTELLHDTRMDRGHQIATRLAEIAEQARRRADRSPNGAEILGPLADLLKYQLGPSQKAVSTKEKAKRSPEKNGQTTPAGSETTH
jgi:hypothetical protein